MLAVRFCMPCLPCNKLKLIAVDIQPPTDPGPCMLNAGVFPLEMDAVCIFLRLKFLPVLCRPFETSKGNLAKTLSRFVKGPKWHLHTLSLAVVVVVVVCWFRLDSFGMSLLRRSRCKEALKEAGGIRGIVCEETRRKDLREVSNSQFGVFCKNCQSQGWTCCCRCRCRLATASKLKEAKEFT